MKSLVWLRRDIRLQDHHALWKACQDSESVFIVFVFDKIILDKLKDSNDKRLTFIIKSLEEIARQLQKKSSSLYVLYGDPIEEIPKFIIKNKITRLYFNRDYEPYAKTRDANIRDELEKKNIDTIACKDHVFFESPEILKKDGSIYKVFTPYKNKWLDKFGTIEISTYKPNLRKLIKNQGVNFDSKQLLQELEFNESLNTLKGGRKHALKHLEKFKEHINDYARGRDFPSLNATSNISPYIRHGCLSIRELVKFARENESEGARVWLNELIWRDFYQMILDKNPHIVKNSFKPQYDQIQWSKSKKVFKAWCNGSTGYPLVDAAMRKLNQTGLMHNRLRMVTASFLCKILHIDWRWGERYFAEKLLDFDLAANNGGWQWSSSSGCDAQPYFRIFNPYTQSKKFDQDGKFIRQWCPELALFPSKLIHQPELTNIIEQSESKCIIGKDYPYPITDYTEAREFTIETLYKVVKKSN